MRRLPLLIFLLLTPLAAVHAAVAAAKAVKPNMVVILTDDMGWGDLSCFGNQEMATPNIDRLAKQGTRFTQFYVASPICSPSRVGYTTGCFPARWRINDYLHSRAGNWKLLINADASDPQLYDLANDPAEAKDLSAEHPEVANQLKTQVLAWRRSLP